MVPSNLYPETAEQLRKMLATGALDFYQASVILVGLQQLASDGDPSLDVGAAELLKDEHSMDADGQWDPVPWLYFLNGIETQRAEVSERATINAELKAVHDRERWLVEQLAEARVALRRADARSYWWSQFRAGLG